MHGVNNPELTKRLNKHVPKTMEEMMITTIAFIRGEAVAASKKIFTHHGKHRTNQSEKLRKGGHSTNECMQLKKQIKELVRAGKLSHLIKEIKHGRDQSKVRKKETPANDKPATIYMIQSWQRMTRQKVTQSFERVREITFPPLSTSSGAEGPLIIEAKIGGLMIHCMYVDGGSLMEKNYMAVGTTQALGNNRRLRSFHKSMDEFHDSHGMLKFPADRGILTIRSTIMIPAEYATVITSSKSHTEAEMLRDIGETFRIKPCPDKKEAVLQLPSPRTIKEVQSLNGKLSSLNRFLSKSAEKSLPFFKTLKKCIKKSDFHWTSKAKQAFKQLKQHLSELPLLVAPKPKEELTVYLSAFYGAISAVLMTERGMVQTLVYFVSRALQVSELNYTPMENLVLSLVFAAKRLRRKITKMKRHSGRTQYHIPTKDVSERTGTLFTDGSSCVDGSGAGLILTSPNGTELTYALRFFFAASNNKAEYEALIAGLRIAAQMGVKNIHASADYNMHAGPRSVVAKAIRLGYYWPTMHRDARDMIPKAKSKMTKYYNARVRGVTFRPGDFVYRSNDASHAVNEWKLGPKWEGLYEVTKALGDSAYKLRYTNGTVLPKTWNVTNLKKCYL
uniref:Reverse transcriptase domain-containing protein n=1 Tax=Tanacetum cinerariifolium TaxID=118510 RepID=A0A6L2KFU9_TANCI|nr:reverse transcriptase domain-containing protein [Tanacetum cinerariifolium]